jgi:mannose-6-phosphate isomerase-like protein (cupin superfamily)
MTVVADAESTGGTLSVIDTVAPVETGPPLHRHSNGETFYVLDGTVAFMVDREIVRVTAGECASVPAGSPHSFRILSPTARMVVICTPGGHERLFTTLGSPAQEGLPPLGGPPSVPEMMARAAEFGFEVLGPPPEELAKLRPEMSAVRGDAVR